MTAGVPGLGLSGLFALLAAFSLPLLRSSPRRSGTRLTGMAILIAVVAVAAWQTVSWLYSVFSDRHPSLGAQRLVGSGQDVLTNPAIGQLFGVPVLVISIGLVMTLLVAGEVLFRVLGVRPTPLPPSIPEPLSRRAPGGPTVVETRGPTAVAIGPAPLDGSDHDVGAAARRASSLSPSRQRPRRRSRTRR